MIKEAKATTAAATTATTTTTAFSKSAEHVRH